MSKAETQPNGGLYETEIQRLQREADNYTRALEHERKRFAIINEEYNQEQKALDEIYGKIKEKIPDEVQEHKKYVQRQSLHHQLQNEKVRLNDTIGENNLLKVDIDIMRKEIQFAKDSIRDMENQIESLRDTAQTVNKKSIGLANTTTNHNNYILSLKAKSESGKEQFELEVKKLQERLQDRYDSDPVKEDDIDGKKGKADSTNKKFDNPIEILKIRLKNIEAKNREKDHLLQKYTRNAQVIEEAFRVIKEGSGITKIDEIVTTFIKSEEQNYALWNYVNQLSQECDNFEENIANTDKEIQRYESIKGMNQNELVNKIVQMSEEAETLKQQILLASEECNEVQEEFAELQQVVEQLVSQFKKARFTTRVSQRIQYDSTTQFNENNITLYLAELEEYFATLISYTASQRGEPNPAISSVPLDTLIEKEFNRKELMIEAPFEAYQKNADGDLTTVGGETDEKEDIVDPRQLYQKFNQLWDNKQIDFVYKQPGGTSGTNNKANKDQE